MNRKLERGLRRLGASSEEIRRAAEEDRLTLLTLDKLLMPGEQRYAVREVAERSGTDVALAQRLWRALGFPDVAPDLPVFTDADVAALEELERRRTTTVAPLEGDSDDALTEQVRLFSAGLSRVAEAVTDQMSAFVRSAADAGLPDEEVALAVLEGLDWASLGRLLDYALRLQARDALWRKLAAADPSAPGALVLAVGFVDLVGYTALSQMLEPDELRALVSRFEQVAFDTVAREGGRVVKTIGDEVMFATGDVAAAARISAGLSEQSEADELLPPARAGLAYGSVLARDGDYFGPVVNLASRLVEIARPGSVLVSDEVHGALVDDDAFSWKRLRSRRLRDIGRVEVWLLAGAG